MSPSSNRQEIGSSPAPWEETYVQKRELFLKFHRFLQLLDVDERRNWLENVDQMLFDFREGLELSKDIFQQQVEVQIDTHPVQLMKETVREKPILLCIPKFMETGFTGRTRGLRNVLLYLSIHASRKYGLPYEEKDFFAMNARSPNPLDETEMRGRINYHFRTRTLYGFNCQFFIDSGFCQGDKCRWYRGQTLPQMEAVLVKP